MPLGASITYGIGSSTGNGYRQFLLEQLTDAGYSVNYVGNEHNGDMVNDANQGHPGKHIADVRHIALEQVPKYKPNLYTINAGTNDAVHDDDHLNAGRRMRLMLRDLWKMTPDATIILSTLIPTQGIDGDGRVVMINVQLNSLVEELAAEGAKIVLANMRWNGPTLDHIPDGTHPDDYGFKLMADIWFDAIEEAKDRGYLD